MTTEEAIKILERTECYVGIHYINGVEDPYINPCLLKAIDYAIAALRAQQNPKVVETDQFKNDPLTLEQLRKMDGEPVWIVEYPDWGHWELSEDAQDYIEDRDTDFYGMMHDDPDGRYGLHKLGWLAYRHKPKEG